MRPLFVPLNLQPEKLVAPTHNPKSSFGVHGPQRNVGSLSRFRSRAQPHTRSWPMPYRKFSRLPFRGQALLSSPLAGGVTPWHSKGYHERKLNEPKILLPPIPEA